MTKIFSRYFAGTGISFIADTWRKKYKSWTFKPAHYFSHLSRDVSAHVTQTSRNKNKFSNAKYDGEECTLFHCWKYIFPIKQDTWLSSRNTNRYRISILQIQQKQEAKTDFTVQYTYFQSLLPCLCPASGCSGYHCMALARCDSGRRFSAFCSGLNSPGGCGCYSCIAHVPGQGRHMKISYYV
jgi:hypothetical protein